MVGSGAGQHTHTVPMLRTSAALVVLFGSLAQAQSGDEWSTFPPSPAPAQPAPRPAAPPASQTPALPAEGSPGPSAPARPATTMPSQESRPAEVRPTSRPTVEAPAPGAPAATTDVPVSPSFTALLGGSDGGVIIVAHEERYLPGTEPHSPSTWGRPWNAQENGRVTVGQAGLGHLFVPTARLGPPGIVRVSLLGEYLNIPDFPVRSAHDIRSAVTFAASFQPFRWGEIFVAYGAAANTNNRTTPNLVQTLGDLTLGVKAGGELLKGLHAAAEVRLLTFAGVGNQGVDAFAVGLKPTALATWDIRQLTASLPLILTATFGLNLDTTASLVRNQLLNASEEFALGVNRWPRFTFGAAAEVPLPVVSPFVEYDVALPLGVATLTSPDGSTVPATAAMRQALGLGLKVTAIKDLTLLAAVEIGLTRSVGLGLPATPPWNIGLGAAFAIDPFQRGETRFVDTIRERQVPRGAWAEGEVTDATSHKPVPGATISLGTARPAATDDAGAFRTLDVPAGTATLSVRREGYKPIDREVTLAAGSATRVDLALEADAPRATFAVTTTAGKKPVKAQVAFTASGEEAAATTVETGADTAQPVTAELPAGQYVVTASAEGYLAQTREVQVTPGAKLSVAFELVPSPKKSLVIFKGDKIDVLQQVHFAVGKATILADSYNLLQQVADAVIKNNVRRLRVEGHTDNRGDRAANQALSEARARAVADFLVTQGFEKQRVQSVGYGDSRPIAPNLTARGRELNRRVEFIVVEK